MKSKITELCKIAYKYGTDKCPQIKHAYTPFYFNLLKNRRESIKKVLEVGIGYYRGMQQNETIYDPGLKRQYHRGASLYMWRDFFPNAQIYGADIRPEAVFKDDRITTFLCDEKKNEDLVELIKNTGSDIDLVVDDASHHVNDQIFLAKNILHLLNKNVTYIIEDVSHSKHIRSALNDIGNFVFDIPEIPRKWHGGMIVVIKNK